jgi:hypothetical protein
MSQQIEAQKGQAGREGIPGAVAGAGLPPKPGRAEPPEGRNAVQESIRYRRRAQEAERRAEALEAEVQELREGQIESIASLEAELAAARTEAGAVRSRLDAVERDRTLEREFVKAGCVDIETALALAHQRLASQEGAAGADGRPAAVGDPVPFVRELLEEKPHLRAAAAGSPALPHPAEGLPPKTAGARTASAGGPRRALERLAQQARDGGTKDLMAYMRARRGHVHSNAETLS